MFLCYNLPINLNISINSKIIERVNNTKFLGVILDENLNFTDHTSLIASKISKSMGILNKVRYLPQSILLTLYNSMIAPYILYGILTWFGCPNYNRNRIQILQNKCIRIIQNRDYRENVYPDYISL